MFTGLRLKIQVKMSIMSQRILEITIKDERTSNKQNIMLM